VGQWHGRRTERQRGELLAFADSRGGKWSWDSVTRDERSGIEAHYLPSMTVVVIGFGGGWCFRTTASTDQSRTWS
jgi:hypothetical protein